MARFEVVQVTNVAQFVNGTEAPKQITLCETDDEEYAQGFVEAMLDYSIDPNIEDALFLLDKEGGVS